MNESSLSVAEHLVSSKSNAGTIAGASARALIELKSPALTGECFNYSMLEDGVASNLRLQAVRIRKRIGKATQDLIDIGYDLQAARQHLDRGQFITWVEAEIGHSASIGNERSRKASGEAAVGNVMTVANILSVTRPKAHILHRETFRTSRLLDFCTERELVKQIGHAADQWPLVILKELVDNALDDAEEAGTPPVTKVEVVDNSIIITDNGRGIPPETVADLLDFSVRVSSREAYVSPTRGAQGNALKTIIAMAFALDGAKGETLIEAKGVAHRISFKVDHVRQQPRIDHVCEDSPVRNGTASGEASLFTNGRRFRLAEPAFDALRHLERRPR